MLGCDQSHRLLREVLPSIGNLIHDKTERVRLAVAKLLLCVKKVPKLKYYHIVPLEHLMARLAIEKNPRNSVAKHLTKLMVNSYAPANGEPVKLLERTLLIVNKYPSSGEAFYSNLRHFREPDFICQLVVYLFQYLNSRVEEALDRSVLARKRQRTQEELSQETHQSSLSFFTIEAVLGIIAVLWESILGDLEGSEEWESYLTDHVTVEMFTTMLEYFGSDGGADDLEEVTAKEDCRNLLFRCIRCLPRQVVVDFFPAIQQSLFTPSKTLSPAQIYLFLYVREIEITSILIASIRAAFDRLHFTVRIGATRKRRSQSSPSSSKTLSPIMALLVLDGILAIEKCPEKDEVLRDQQLERTIWEGIQQVHDHLIGALVSD